MHRGVYIVILLLVRISIQAADQLTPLSTVAGLAHGAQAPQNGTVSALAVADYAPGHYTGPLTPSPPHADRNPRQAVIIAWPGLPARFIFSHEASYCPIFEFPSGAAMCNQFFEGNLGEAELMNNLGRKEKNSSVEIMEAGPARAWVRWTYLAVNMRDDSQPRLRGTEDYFAYPNGLVLRKASYISLMPDATIYTGTKKEKCDAKEMMPRCRRFHARKASLSCSPFEKA
ncbi:MAG: hypothetical protein EBT89_05965 [Opitutaceae bacterium]|nr:hypothetical protein [Opitutaceae bacterium]